MSGGGGGGSGQMTLGCSVSLVVVVEEAFRQICARPEDRKNKKRWWWWWWCVLIVCSREVDVTRGTRNPRRGRRSTGKGAFYLAAQYVLMLAQLLQTCCVIYNLQS